MHCSVPYCTNDWQYEDRYKAKCGKELHFHQFSADKQRRKDWIFARLFAIYAEKNEAEENA